MARPILRKHRSPLSNNLYMACYLALTVIAAIVAGLPLYLS